MLPVTLYITYVFFLIYVCSLFFPGLKDFFMIHIVELMLMVNEMYYSTLPDQRLLRLGKRLNTVKYIIESVMKIEIAQSPHIIVCILFSMRLKESAHTSQSTFNIRSHIVILIINVPVKMTETAQSLYSLKFILYIAELQHNISRFTNYKRTISHLI